MAPCVFQSPPRESRLLGCHWKQQAAPQGIPAAPRVRAQPPLPLVGSGAGSPGLQPLQARCFHSGPSPLPVPSSLTRVPGLLAAQPSVSSAAQGLASSLSSRNVRPGPASASGHSRSCISINLIFLFFSSGKDYTK